VRRTRTVAWINSSSTTTTTIIISPFLSRTMYCTYNTQNRLSRGDQHPGPGVQDSGQDWHEPLQPGQPGFAQWRIRRPGADGTGTNSHRTRCLNVARYVLLQYLWKRRVGLTYHAHSLFMSCDPPPPKITFIQQYRPCDLSRNLDVGADASSGLPIETVGSVAESDGQLYGSSRRRRQRRC
jgi:hypothetical protein